MTPSEQEIQVTSQVTSQDQSLNKLAEFISDVLSQLSNLQGITSAHISEIAELQAKVNAYEERINILEGFNKAIKLRLRQQREPGI
jgi:DNA repair ATPase RecN